MLLKTKEALEKEGIEVKLFNQWEDKLKDFDILHVFGSAKECVGLMQAARDLGVKTALSPIFWSTWQRTFFEYGSFLYRSRLVIKHALKVFFPYIPSSRRRMFELADLILPNSEAEADQVSRLFAIGRNKMQVVPLAADARFAKATPEEFIKKYGLRDFILSVGRIEPRKNQLNLVKALKGLTVPGVFIGSPVHGYEEYYGACKRAAGKDTLFIDRLEHNDTLLASAYAACSVFVLQGWFETPGLVALEAGLAGARLAVTKGGSTREYFASYAEYFRPESPASILRAIERALKKDKEQGLKERILNNYLWGLAAKANIKVYQRLLKV